jgi:mannose-6-phosphate isomerase-like protein (cupin superfamily)
MNIQAYIDSGILQDYSLGILSHEEALSVEVMAEKYPEITLAIRSYQLSLENFANEFRKELPVGLKEKTLDLLDNLHLEKQGGGTQFPLLNKYAARENWLRMIKPIIPEELDGDMYSKILRDDEKVFQTILWLRTDYPDEVHDDLRECFMVLEGECECHVAGEVIKLGPGGFFEIPLHQHHDVKVTKGPVLAIIQRLKATG